ncbi:MAG: ABC transporter permease [Microbacterium sp. 69-10]|uniref:carbohydrate ABC transporter permease n=1 Tax=Microbacterium sp. 69-10 TaxID=1895783 RepID=UPI00095BCB43|nr:carbohydrate ABC transporter permease [Microbacterium sp. 69-10]OJU39060.1 MAG: ABC transporter permease [Microbacterium sp. 69-10]
MTESHPARTAAAARPAPRRRMRAEDAPERAILSATDRRRPGVRVVLFGVQALILVGLLIAGAGPILWLAKSAVSTTQDILTQPFGLWPSGIQLGNLVEAWNRSAIGRYMFNTVIIAAGQAVVTLFVCTTCAYCLSVLRPKWGPWLQGAILATLFIPGIVVLVPLYLTVLNLPGTGGTLIDNYLAIWLPGAANAFMILVIKRFFDALPRDLFEAARLDGAGAWRTFFSIVLPLSRPIMGVVALLTVMGSWKDFLWPMLVLPTRTLQPVSVALFLNLKNTELAIQLAALFLALLVPVILFVIFQKQFLRGVSASAGVKG